MRLFSHRGFRDPAIGQTVSVLGAVFVLLCACFAVVVGARLAPSSLGSVDAGLDRR